MTLCTERIRTLDDIRAFLDGNEAADITPHNREAAYAFVERTLVRFRYHIGLSRAGKGLVRAFLATGYSDAQLTRLIAQQRRTGHIRDHRLRPPSRPFATVYTTGHSSHWRSGRHRGGVFLGELQFDIEPAQTTLVLMMDRSLRIDSSKRSASSQPCTLPCGPR